MPRGYNRHLSLFRVPCYAGTVTPQELASLASVLAARITPGLARLTGDVARIVDIYRRQAEVDVHDDGTAPATALAASG
jgi:hypothetical protein